jgi:hypothetical protein
MAALKANNLGITFLLELAMHGAKSRTLSRISSR